jgi:hypothetical protein
VDFKRSQGDKIDLKAIDANEGWPPGNQDFNWKTQLEYGWHNKKDGILTVKVGDAPDLQIILLGKPPLDLNVDIIG